MMQCQSICWRNFASIRVNPCSLLLCYIPKNGVLSTFYPSHSHEFAIWESLCETLMKRGSLEHVSSTKQPLRHKIADLSKQFYCNLTMRNLLVVNPMMVIMAAVIHPYPQENIMWGLMCRYSDIMTPCFNCLFPITFNTLTLPRCRTATNRL